eukprot:3453553-Rhodomonas_salina.2
MNASMSLLAPRLPHTFPASSASTRSGGCQPARFPPRRWEPASTARDESGLALAINDLGQLWSFWPRHQAFGLAHEYWVWLSCTWSAYGVRGLAMHHVTPKPIVHLPSRAHVPLLLLAAAQPYVNTGHGVAKA